MTKQTQQEYLNSVKAELAELLNPDLTWDELADMAGITTRAFKTYRMPESSKDYRKMSILVRGAIERMLLDRKKTKRRGKK